MEKKHLSTIMRRAHIIAHRTSVTFSAALCKSWQLHYFTERLRAGVVRFSYEKADGTLRHAVGTLRTSAEFVRTGQTPDNGKTIKYYDLEAKGFRSFKVENFIIIY